MVSCEFEVSLIYIASTRPARTTGRQSQTKQNKTQATMLALGSIHFQRQMYLLQIQWDEIRQLTNKQKGKYIKAYNSKKRSQVEIKTIITQEAGIKKEFKATSTT